MRSSGCRRPTPRGTLDLAATGGEVQVNVDGASVFDDPNAMTDPVADPQRNFYVGISTGAPETTTVHVFYDDVAMSVDPIGCQ